MIFAYDSADNLVSETNACGFVTTYTYDDLHGRTWQVDPPQVDTHQSWSYDVAGDLHTPIPPARSMALPVM